MIKKLLTLTAFLSIAGFASAQCTINQNVFTSSTDYGIVPDTVTNLPLAYVALSYNTDLQIHVAPDTTTGLGTFPITQIKIDSVTGLPAGFSYSPNPSNGIFPGGSYGCVAVTGLATAGQENGGPMSNGVYPIIVYFTATVNVFSVPTDFPSQQTGYKVHIMPASSVGNTIDLTKFSVMQNQPNPSDNRTEFRFNAPVAGDVEMTVYNTLGEKVHNRTIKAEKGLNKISYETSSLSSGVYLYSFRMGNAVLTKRMSVTH